MKSRKWRLISGILVAVLVIAVFGAVSVWAATLNVNATTGTVHTGHPCPVPRDSAVYADIQAAINCAQAGDTINVAAGTYNENVTVDKRLSLL